MDKKFMFLMAILLLVGVLLSCVSINIYSIKKICVDNVQYIQSGAYITVAYDTTGKIKTCKE